jgi:L-fuconolactonase
MRIDAHQHFWSYQPDRYPWIGPGMEVLKRDFLPEHLEGPRSTAGLEASIAVQARSDVQETEWLLELARTHPAVKGVVGWVDLASPDVGRDLARLSQNPILRGVRHILQDEPDDAHMLRPEFRRGIAMLADLELVYDILVYPRHLPHAVRLVEEFPEQRFVLDHLAKPPIKSGNLEPWRRDLRELARYPNVACKVSGMVTEADWDHWTAADLVPYLDAVFEAFSEDRLLFGSDWPVCLLAAPDYATVVDVVEAYARQLAPEARSRLFGGNAIRWYHRGQEGAS